MIKPMNTSRSGIALLCATLFAGSAASLATADELTVLNDSLNRWWHRRDLPMLWRWRRSCRLAHEPMRWQHCRYPSVLAITPRRSFPITRRSNHRL